MQKIAYVCGPLTELSGTERQYAKNFYEAIASMFEKATGMRAFVPHEHFDPVLHANFSPCQVDTAERRQVCELTSVLVVVALAPSWGGGIEVEMANRSDVPVIILKQKKKKVSRLLLGNPAVLDVIEYEAMRDAVAHLFALIEVRYKSRVVA